MKQRMLWTLPLVLLVSAILIGGSGACLAQNTNSGDIRGTATDSTGAVVPGVNVSVSDLDQGVTRSYSTDGAGLYDTGPIPEDHYQLTFTKDGFKTFVRGPVTISLGFFTVNAVLQVGQVSQQVLVSTDIPLLNTESGSLEPTLTADSMDELPQVGSGNGGGADWENFIQLMPGAVGTPENQNGVAPGQGGTVGTTASINGNLPYASYMQDGATTTLPMSENSDVTVFETTAEVKVSATAFSAQYGLGDIVYNQITKSGTDKFHGAAYEYNQNVFFNAANYAFGTGKANIIHFNNFGGAIGGPVLPSKIFHKSFFYFDYDHTINNSTGGVQTQTLASTAMMGGDFSQAGLPTLYDPTTQTIVPTGTCTYLGPQYGVSGMKVVPAPCVMRTSFEAEAGNPGNQAYNKLPPGLIDPAAKAIQAYLLTTKGYPSTVASYAANNFKILGPAGTNPFIKYFGRWDTDLSANNRLTLTETESNNPAFNPAIFAPLNNQFGDVSRDNAAISDVWTVSPHVINEARMGFTDQLNFFVPVSEGKGYKALLDLPLLQADVFPGIGINGFYGPGSATHAIYKEMLFDPTDVVTMIKGRHVLHFGGEFLINRADSTAWGNINPGGYSFNGLFTAQGAGTTNGNDGMSYADFLIGQSTSWGANITPEFAGRWKAPQLFVQDDFKVKPNLTLNLGVRYEIETGWRDQKGNQTTFDPAVLNENVSASAINGIAPGALVQGGMWYGFEGQNGRTSLQKPKYDIWLPRFGFSWQVLPSTVIRGGIGLFASEWSEDTYGGGEGSAFGTSGGYGDNTNGFCPAVQLSANGTTPDTTDAGCGTVGGYNGKSELSTYLTAPTTPFARNGQSPSYNEYNTPVPLNYQWDLTVERSFLRDWVASVGYVGNHGDHQNFPVDIDQVPQALLGPADNQFEPYPIYNQINGSTNNGISNYAALQAILTKRMSYGLQFSVNYGWSHFLDDGDSAGWANRGGYQNYQNAFNPAADYSNSDFDVTQAIRGEVVYQLPFGKGKQFLNDNLIADEVLGGWQVSSTFIGETGNPVSMTTAGFNSSNNQSGSYTQYANLVGNYKTTDTGPDAVPGNTYHSLREYYNEDAFALPALYTYGDFNRDTLRGPDLTNVNFAIGKSFDVWPERNVKFQIRGSANNILNHPSFGQPGTTLGGPPASEINAAQINSITIGGRVWEMYGRLSF
jgi:Carboxypeptidase regulatory-like domain